MSAGAQMRALSSACGWATMTLAIVFPIAGLQLVESAGELAIRPHFDSTIAATAAVFIWRYLLVWSRDRRYNRLPGIAPRARIGSTQIWQWRKLGRVAGPAMALFAVVLPLLPWSSRYIVDTGTAVLIYVMLGWGLNIVVGRAGLLDLGYVAFYAVGAYTYAILIRDLGLDFWACLPLAGALAALFGVVLGFPVLRLRGDYLAIVTLGFGEIIRIAIANWDSLTGGAIGMFAIARPSFFGAPFIESPPPGTTSFHQLFGIAYSTEHRVVFFYYVILAMALLTAAVGSRLRVLPLGRAWEALREDEGASRALGINPTTTKLAAFGIGAMFGGFAGAFFAARQGFISPESFTFAESAAILAIVVLGGLGSQTGVVLGALILIILPELGRDFAEYRMLFFGSAILAIMLLRPHGLISAREPTIKLAERVQGAKPKDRDA